MVPRRDSRSGVSLVRRKEDAKDSRARAAAPARCQAFWALRVRSSVLSGCHAVGRVAGRPFRRANGVSSPARSSERRERRGAKHSPAPSDTTARQDGVRGSTGTRVLRTPAPPRPRSRPSRIAHSEIGPVPRAGPAPSTMPKIDSSQYLASTATPTSTNTVVRS